MFFALFVFFVATFPPIHPLQRHKHRRIYQRMDIAATLSLIFTGLKKAIAARAYFHDTELLNRAYKRVNRTTNRLVILFLAWRAGKLPKPRKSRAGQKRKSSPRLHLPTGRAWLHLRVPPTPTAFAAMTYGTQLEHLIATEAELQKFLAEVPQAMRYINPIRHMLGTGPEPAKRQRKPRPPKPPAPPRQPRRPVYPLLRPRPWKILKA